MNKLLLIMLLITSLQASAGSDKKFVRTPEGKFFIDGGEVTIREFYLHAPLGITNHKRYIDNLLVSPEEYEIARVIFDARIDAMEDFSLNIGTVFPTCPRPVTVAKFKKIFGIDEDRAFRLALGTQGSVRRYHELVRASSRYPTK